MLPLFEKTYMCRYHIYIELKFTLNANKWPHTRTHLSIFPKYINRGWPLQWPTSMKPNCIWEKSGMDHRLEIKPIRFSSVAQSCLTLCDSMNHSTPGLPVHHQLPEFTQIHVHWVGDVIQAAHPLLSPSPPPSIFPSIRVFSNESVLRHQVTRILEFQLQHQSFQWIFRTDFL